MQMDTVLFIYCKPCFVSPVRKIKSSARDTPWKVVGREFCVSGSECLKVVLEMETDYLK